jgi:hypothetical protein
MKIYTKIVLDKDNNIIEEQSYDYTGPIAHCGNGGEDGSAGSSAQEAANFEDYNTDLVDSSVSIDEFGTSSSFDDYSSQDNEEQQAIDAATTTRNNTTYDAGGQDPAVPANYKAGIGRTDYFNPNDTATSYKNNLSAELRASPVLALATPIGLLGKVAIQTARTRSMLDLPVIPGGSKSSGGGNNTNTSSGGDNDNNTMNVVRQVNVQGTGLPEPSSFITQTSFPNTNLTMQLYNQMKGLLNTPSKIGLLAVNESPFYDFLKQRNLDRRVL